MTSNFSRARLRFAVPAMGINFLETYFWMRFGFPAMGISVLEEVWFSGRFSEFLLLRLETMGESVLEV